MKKLHYAWLICLAGILMMFCSIGLVSNVFSVVQPYIIKYNNFTCTQGSFLVTLRMISALLSLVIIDGYYKKLDIRLGATLAIASIGLSYIVYAYANSYVMYAIGAFLSGIGYSLGAMIPVSIIIRRWFKSHLALALSLCSAGTGVATVIMPPIITLIVEGYSLKTAFIILSIIVFAFTIIIWLLIRNTPQEVCMEPLLSNKEKIKIVKTAKQNEKGIGKRDYWIMLIALFLYGGVGSNGFIHLGVLYTSENYTSSQVASIISVAGFLLILGKCTFGEVNDRIGSYKSNSLFCALLVMGLVGCCLAPLHSGIILALTLIMIGFGFPTNNLGVPIWAKDLSNDKTFTSTLKYFQLSYSCGTMVFSYIVGLSADFFESYIPIYILFTVVAFFFTITLQLIYRKNNIK